MSYEKSITKYVFFSGIPISFHLFYPFSFWLFPQFTSKKMMQFKKQETHNRITQIFKLLWRQQNFHWNVQHRLIAAFLAMCWFIQFLSFQYLLQPEPLFMGFHFLIVVECATIARYHSRFTRIIFLLNGSTEIMKLVLKFLCILYFNLAIENWSVYKTNLLDAKKSICKITKTYRTW